MAFSTSELSRRMVASRPTEMYFEWDFESVEAGGLIAHKSEYQLYDFLDMHKALMAIAFDDDEWHRHDQISPANSAVGRMIQARMGR